MYSNEVPYKGKDDFQKAALRIYDGKKEIFYASTSLGSLVKNDAGFTFETEKDFKGKEYQLTLLPKRDIEKGKLTKVTKVVQEKEDADAGSKKV